MLRRSSRVVRLIESCLPSPAKAPPSGLDWLHEIKHDGFRILARRDLKRVRLVTRNGHDFSKRFPQVVAAVAAIVTVRAPAFPSDSEPNYLRR
jgi:ATP-dependent DNA ligase